MQQMYSCPNCGAQVAFGVKFCTGCGTPLNWPAQQQTQPLPSNQQQMYSCPGCGSPVPFGTRFCPNCRAQLNWPSQPQTQPPLGYQKRKAMGLSEYFEKKRKEKEKERLRRLAEDFRNMTKKQGKRSETDSSPSNSKGKLKPSIPIHRDVVLRPGVKSCPKCGSHYIRPAGYGDRSECQDCGKVFI